jgi:hypothetical protein
MSQAVPSVLTWENVAGPVAAVMIARRRASVGAVADPRPRAELGPIGVRALDGNLAHQLGQGGHPPVPLAKHQHERHRPAQAVAADVQLAVGPAAAATQRLAELPGFPPAA